MILDFTSLLKCLRHVLVLGLAAAFSTAGCRPPATGHETKRYHVVLLVIDTLRADRIGANGFPLPATPNIDRLAAAGVTFTNAFAPATWTRPSVATLMTSLYPSEHGLLGISDDEGRIPKVLDDRFETLAEAFSSAGYTAVGFHNQVYLKYKYGFGQGFDYYKETRGNDAFQIQRRFEGWLDTFDGDRLFAYLHLLDTHWPYNNRLPSVEPDAFGPADESIGAPTRGSEVAAWASAGLDSEALETLEARYAHEVSWTDAAVGELVDTLERRGLLDDTILVLTSDHGEGFAEHGELLHGYLPYDEVIQVPMIVRFPKALGIASGPRQQPVGLIDLMPTLLDLNGLPIPDQCRGRSLLPALLGTAGTAPPIFVETETAKAIRTADHKLILHDDQRLELYDTDADPGETRNLADPCLEPCREALGQLLDFEQTLVPYGGEEASDVEVSAEDIEELRALGYLAE